MATKYCTLCRKNTSERIVFVPRNESKRALWSRITGVQFTGSSRICASHFNDSDFYYSSEKETKRRRLLPTAVPQKLQGNKIVTKHMASTCGQNRFNFSSQTQQEGINSGIALENLRLQKQVAKLKKENATLHQRLQEMQTLSDLLKFMFTESQARKLQNEGRGIVCLSLDQLDQFFDVIWEENDLHDHPTASEIQLRLRKYLLENSCFRLELAEKDIHDKKIQREPKTTSENKDKEYYPENPEYCTSSSSCKIQDELNDVRVQSELLETEEWELSEPNSEIKIEENEFVPIESVHFETSYGIQNNEPKLIFESKAKNVTKQNRFKCPQCSKIFRKCSNFNAHIRAHSSEQRPFEQINKCLHCGQYFKDSDELVEHIRIHTGEQTYSCTECSKEFGYAWQLETHMRKHTGEQPFKCPHCPETCKNTKDLVNHVESFHSWQRLHKCPQCSKAFISVYNLEKHINSHHINSSLVDY